MQFGITLKPDISVERIVGLTRQAEAAGFEYGWSLTPTFCGWTHTFTHLDGRQHEADAARHAGD